MLTEICQYLRNWFDKTRIIGTFTIENGVISYGNGNVIDLLTGQYFRIVGSVLNDGVYAYPVSDLKNETFDGAVWYMAVPPELVTLSQEIEEWIAANNTAILSPYQSESFGGYSYNLRGSSNSSGQQMAPTWQSQFAARLAPWRKI